MGPSMSVTQEVVEETVRFEAEKHKTMRFTTHLTNLTGGKTNSKENTWH